MKGFNCAEEGHVVNVLPPVDITGGKTGDVFTMERHAHVSIIIQIGVSAAAFTAILLKECTSFAAAGATAIAFNYYAETTAAGDTLAARAAATAAGITPSANDNIMYIIELDASELSDGYQYVQLALTNTTNSVLASAVAILSGSRYAKDANATVIA